MIRKLYRWMMRARVRSRVERRKAERVLIDARWHREVAWLAYYHSNVKSSHLFMEWVKWDRLIRDYEQLLENWIRR